MYRKNLLMAMPNLYYLDERPVFEAERLCADAFKLGGKDEEERVRSEWADHKKKKEVENTARGTKIEEESRSVRKQ
jgi:dynein assembly factor 1